MLRKIFIVLAFLAVCVITAFTQNPIESTVEYVWTDTLWIAVKVNKFETEFENRFRVTRDTTPLGDTTTVRNALLAGSISPQLQLARSYRLPLFSNQVDAVYNGNKSVFEIVTGEKWEKGLADEIGGGFIGRYRVRSDTSDFFANVVVLESGANEGRLRMEREDNSDQWLFNPKSQESFQLQGSRVYWVTGATGSIEFVWDFQSADRKVYRPRAKTIGSKADLPAQLRIIKVQ